MLFGVIAVGIVLPASAANAEPTPSQLAQQIENASIQLEKIVEQYNLVTERLKGTQAAIAELTAKMTPLQADLDATSVNVTQLAVSAYKGSPVTTMPQPAAHAGRLHRSQGPLRREEEGARRPARPADQAAG